MPDPQASTPNERNLEDAGAPMGVATTQFEQRALSSEGIGHAPAVFVPSESVYGAGVLILLPALLAQGLLKTNEVYTLPPGHYYSLESVMLTISIMCLSSVS